MITEIFGVVAVVQCPARPEAYLYNGACYEIRRAANLDRQTSQYACQSRGGELVSLHSRDEAEFVHSVSHNGPDVVINLWIGLSRKGQ